MIKKIVLITGASQGLGREVAIKYGTLKYFVGINYNKNKEKAEEIKKQIIKLGGEAICLKANVSNFTEVKKMIEKILEKWGRIDILINNAGITYDVLLLKIKESIWQDVIGTNLKGCFNCIKAVIEKMIKQKDGYIINISSLAAFKGQKGQGVYSASKAGIIGLTKSLASEFGNCNIKINAILPGYMLTEMGKKTNSEMIEKIKKENVLGRLSNLTEIADFIVYLTRTENISGQIFNLDSRII